MGRWSMSMTLSRCSSPLIVSQGRGLARAVQAQRRGLEQRLDGQGRFAAARDAGDADELAKRKPGGYVLEVVAGGAHHGQRLAVALAAVGRHRNLARAGQVLAGQAGGVGGDLVGRALADDAAAMHARARPHVEDIVGVADRVLVMFDHDHRIALIAQVHQRAQQPVVVALMQPDGGFVQHIQNAGQAAADLAGQTDALRFAARQGARRARQGQIVQPDIDQKAKPFADFLENGGRDLVLLFRQVIGRVLHPDQRLVDRQLDHLPDMAAGDLDRQRLGFQAIAVAGAAGAVVLIPLEFLADPLAVGFAQAALHVGDHPSNTRLTSYTRPASSKRNLICSSPDPCRNMRCTASGRSFHGVFLSKP